MAWALHGETLLNQLFKKNQIMKNYQKLFTMLTLGALALSCSSDTDENVITEPQGQVTLSASAQSISSASDARGRTVVNGFATTGFTVGSQDV